MIRTQRRPSRSTPLRVETLEGRQLLSLTLGFSDSDPETVTAPWRWDASGVRRLRAVAPYDVATSAAEAGPRDRFVAWYDAVSGYNRSHPGSPIEMAVALTDHFGTARKGDARSQYPDGTRRAPQVYNNYPVPAETVVAFDAAFKAFLDRFPAVKVIAPWNEPNNRSDPIVLKDKGRKLSDEAAVSGASTANYGPLAAAYYWKASNDIAGGPKYADRDLVLIAGEFSAGTGATDYAAEYKDRLEAIGVRPEQVKVWGIHPYRDVDRYQAGDVPPEGRKPPEQLDFARHAGTIASGTRNFLNTLVNDEDDPRWARGHLWLSEIGARYTDEEGKVLGEASQAKATAYILRLPEIDPRITRVYYYNFQDSDHHGGKEDQGVLDRPGAGGAARTAFRLIQDRATNPWLDVRRPGELTIMGSDGDNRIAVTKGPGQTWLVAIDGTSYTVDPRPGPNAFNPYNVPVTRIKVDGKDGSDSVTVSPLLNARVSVVGGGGVDNLYFSDPADVGSGIYTVTASTVGRAGGATVTYDVEALTLTGGGGADTFNIAGSRAGTSLNINGGGGRDALNIDDSAGNAGLTYTVGATEVSRSGAARIRYDVEDLALTGGGGNDTFDVTGSKAGTSLNIRGGGGRDALFVNDGKAATGGIYSVTSSSVSRAGAASISHDVEDLSLTGGAGDDTFDLRGARAGMPIRIIGGGGRDILNIFAPARTAKVTHDVEKVNSP